MSSLRKVSQGNGLYGNNVFCKAFQVKRPNHGGVWPPAVRLRHGLTSALKLRSTQELLVVPLTLVT